MDLLFEEVDSTNVIDAIKKHYEVKVNYAADDDEQGSGMRLIQPVAFGKSKSGNLVVRAYQPFGDTKTKVPHWKLFRLDRFTEWKPLKKRKFNEAPDDKYNPNGDKSMSEVYVLSDFYGRKQRYERGGLKKYNIERQAKAKEQDPYHDLKQNIKKSFMVDPKFMKYVQDWQKNKPEAMQRYLNGASADEMANTTKFGDEEITQTNGPISKNDTELKSTPQRSTQKSKVNDYKNIANNGPIIKQQKQEVPVEPEESEIENNKEKEDNLNNNGSTTN